jgi:hypothetical protein
MKMNHLFRLILRWLQRRCEHEELRADLLEGDARDLAVRWCPVCGAVQVVYPSTTGVKLRLPEPTWYPALSPGDDY